MQVGLNGVKANNNATILISPVCSTSFVGLRIAQSSLRVGKPSRATSIHRVVSISAERLSGAIAAVAEFIARLSGDGLLP